MKRAFSTLALVLVVRALLPAAPQETAAEIIARLRTLRAGTDFKASGRLVRVTSPEQRVSYQFTMQVHAFPGVLRLLCAITEPAAVRVRLLLESPSPAPGGRPPAGGQPSPGTRMRIGHPGDAAPRDLPFERWGEGVLDTGFTFEDLIEDQFLWSSQSLKDGEKCGARECVVLVSQPGPPDRTHYLAVTSWLDQDILYPVRAEKIVRASGAVKEFTYYGLRQSKGIWSASQIEVKVKGQPGSSLLITTRGGEKPNLTASAFDPAILIKP